MKNLPLPTYDDFFPPFVLFREDGQVAYGEEWAYRQALAAGYPVSEHSVTLGKNTYTVSVAVDPKIADDPSLVYRSEAALLTILNWLSMYADPSRAKLAEQDVKFLYERIAEAIRTHICADLRVEPFVYDYLTGTITDADNFMLTASLAAAYLCRAGNEDLTLAFESPAMDVMEIVFRATRVPLSLFFRDLLSRMGICGKYYVLFSEDGIHFRFFHAPVTYVVWHAPAPFDMEDRLISLIARFLGIRPDKPGISYYD